MEALYHGLSFLAQELHDRTNDLADHLRAQAGCSELLSQMIPRVDHQFRARQQREQGFQSSMQNDMSSMIARVEQTVATLHGRQICRLRWTTLRAAWDSRYYFSEPS